MINKAFVNNQYKNLIVTVLGLLQQEYGSVE